MKAYIVDIETNGLLPELDTVHSIVIRDADSGELIGSYAGQGDLSDGTGYPPCPTALGRIGEADILIGHNITKFDLPALHKVYAWAASSGVKVYDTLNMARLLWPERREQDFKLNQKGKLPGQFIGRHSLEAWGHRLGCWKGDYKGGWDEWSEDMQDYCEQDTLVTFKLWQAIKRRMDKLGYSWWAIDNVEQPFLEIVHRIEQTGWKAHKERVLDLYADLSKQRGQIEDELQEVFPPWWKKLPKKTVPKTRRVKQKEFADVTIRRFSEKTGKELKPYVGPPLCEYEAGAEYTPIVRERFNPGSRDHVAKRLIHKYAWKPQEFTKDGKPTVDEDVLKSLPYPEAKVLARYYLICKRIGQVAEGKEAWLKHLDEETHKIHPQIDPAKAVTRRCGHSKPPIAQVVKVKKDKRGNVLYGEEGLWGYECRNCFIPSFGKLVGVDAEGLELRCLAHYMARYDGGQFRDTLLQGDIHTANQEAAGLPSRDNAKTFIYGFLYGAGNEKIGAIIGKGAKAGAKLKSNFLKRTPALKRLREDVAERAKKRKNHLKAVDGGMLKVRHSHASLNTLLQSAGAIVVKRATVLLYQDLSARGWVWGEDYAFVGHIHDEIQSEVKESLTDEFGEAATAAFRRAGEDLGFRCPIDAEAKVGNSWAETH